MNIRLSTNEDSQEIYRLHIESIQFYCSPHYSPQAIGDWIKIKTINEYSCDQSDRLIFVVEEKKQILGFSMINTKKNSIESLYVKPYMSGKGLGAALLKHIEKIAYEQKIEELLLHSTLNAVPFYRAMGYQGEVGTVFKLSTGTELDCVTMTKKLIC